ncbi:MAG: O-antigen ligase family protein [archaeon]
MFKTTIKINRKTLFIALLSSFLILPFQFLILNYFDIIGTTAGNQVQNFSKALVGIFYLLAFPYVFKKKKKIFINTYIISFFIFLSHIFIFSQNAKQIINLIFPFFFMSLPSFIYAYSIENLNEFKKVMFKLSKYILLIGFVISILNLLKLLSIGSYSMSLSYYMLLPALMYLNYFFNKKKLSYILFFLISLMIIISFGARGPILCISIYFLYELIRFNKKMDIKSFILYVLIIFSLIIIVFFYEDILIFINDFLGNFGIRSRTINLFIRENIHMSGRDDIFMKGIQTIRDNPLIGVGIAGDRHLRGNYIHNIFLEILMNYGVIIGLFLIILILSMSIWGIFLNEKNKSDLIAIWFCMGFVPLLVSSSYLIKIEFWIFLGILFNLFSRKSKIKLINDGYSSLSN